MGHSHFLQHYIIQFHGVVQLMESSLPNHVTRRGLHELFGEDSCCSLVAGTTSLEKHTAPIFRVGIGTHLPDFLEIEAEYSYEH
jgi:hypothetical protein